MAQESSKKVSGYLGSDHYDLQLVFMKIAELQTLTHKISAYLEPQLAKYCEAAHITNHKLIMLAANGSIATQLRLMTNDLLKKFSLDPALKHIHQIDYKVQPNFGQVPAFSRSYQKKPMQRLSPATAEIIRHIAENIDDNALKEVMLRIAKRT